MPRKKNSSHFTLQGTNISHLGKRKIIFKIAWVRDMLVPGRVRRSRIRHVCSFRSFDDRFKHYLFHLQTGAIVFESKLIPFPMKIKTSHFNGTFLIKHCIKRCLFVKPCKEDVASFIHFNDHTKGLERRRLHSKRLRNSAPNLGSSPNFEQSPTQIFSSTDDWSLNTPMGPQVFLLLMFIVWIQPPNQDCAINLPLLAGRKIPNL